MDAQNNPKPAEENVPKFRGLYRHVKISVKALDWIIVACIAVIIIVVAFEMLSPGLTVTFDTQGGTDVASQTQEAGEKLTLPEPPTREGYTFTGWYRDPTCDIPWNVETDTVDGDLTLYAGWQKTQ